MLPDIPDEYPYHRAEWRTEHVDGIGPLHLLARADSMMLRTVPAHERDRMTGGNLPADHVTFNGKDYKLDVTVRRGDDGTWQVNRSQFGILGPVGIGIGPGTPSAEKKAAALVQAWADRYAEDHVATIGYALSVNETRYYLTRSARELGAAYVQTMDALARLDDADMSEVAELAAVAHRWDLRKNDR